VKVIGRRVAATLVALTAVFVALLAAGLTTGAEPAAAASRCWEHSLQVVANLRADPPDATLVVLFGGSRARESTVDDPDWSAELTEKHVEPVVAYNLGASNQTFTEDLALVRHLPASSTLVLIAVDEGRFTKDPGARPVALPDPSPLPSGREQHRYGIDRRNPTAKKRGLVDDWLERRYPLFRQNVGANAEELDRLVATCLDRGLQPVLLATPWNTAIIEDAFDDARREWQAACDEVAADHDIPFLDFSTDVELGNADFHDLFHLVGEGRVRWQKRLSAEVADLLDEGVSSAESDPDASGSDSSVNGLAGDAREESASLSTKMGVGLIAVIAWEAR